MAINLPIVSTFDGAGVTGAIAGIKNLGAKLLGFGAIVAGAFVVREVIQFGRSAIEAAQAVEVANRRLEAVAKATNVFGVETAKVTDRLIKFAESQEMIIGQDAEVIKGVQAVMLSFKSLSNSADDVGGNFDRATKAAFDMAAVLQTDASTQAMALAKALEDPVKGVTALRRAGTLFTEQQRDQIKAMVDAGDVLGAQNLILAEVESQYGGAAEATATFADKVRLGFDNIKEAAGKALMPAFEEFSKFLLNDVIPPIQTFFEEDFPGILEAAGPVVQSLVDGFGEMGDAIKTFLDIPADQSLLEGLLTKLGDLKDNPTFQKYMESLADSLADIAPDAKDAVTELGNLATALEPTITDAVKDAFGAFASILSILTSISSILRTLSGTTMPETDDAVKNTEATWTRLIPVIGSMLGEDGWLKLLENGFKDLATGIEEQAPRINAFWAGFKKMSYDALNNTSEAIKGTLTNIGMVFSGAWSQIVARTQQWVSDMNTTIRNTPLYQAAVKIIQDFWNGLVNTWNSVAGWLSSIPGRIRSAFGGADLSGVGRDIMNGLLNGLKSAWTAVANWVNAQVNWIINSFKNALKIKSPSQVFFDIGENVVQGLLNGLDSLSPQVDMTMGNLVTPESVTPGFATSPRMMGGGGINVTVNAGMGTNGAEVGRLVVNAIRDYERRNGQVFASA